MVGEDVSYELAVRLGGISTFDRHGKVIWMDGFEEGIGKWGTSLSGSGAAVELAVAYARSGLYSCKLTCGSDVLEFAQISRLLAFPLLGRMGFELSWAHDDDLVTMGIEVNLLDGTYAHSAVLRYDHSSSKLEYQDDDKMWAELASGVDLYTPGFPFWTWKLVVDFESQEYVRAVVNETLYDLAGVGYYVAEESGTAHLQLRLQAVGENGANAVAYIDDVIVTQNEP